LKLIGFHNGPHRLKSYKISKENKEKNVHNGSLRLILLNIERKIRRKNEHNIAYESGTSSDIKKALRALV
jgi:hypothetical protein